MTLPQALPLIYHPIFSRENFVVSEPNLLAVQSLPSSAYLWGPSGSGKTHLATIWQSLHPKARMVDFSDLTAAFLEETFADPESTVIENLGRNPSRAQEEHLLHLYNILRSAQKPLLITAAFPLPHFAGQLPDLTTRLTTLSSFTLGEPDDDLLLGILLKRFSDLGITATERALAFLLKHIPRSYEALHHWTTRLQHATLTSPQTLTIPLIKRLLA